MALRINGGMMMNEKSRFQGGANKRSVYRAAAERV